MRSRLPVLLFLLTLAASLPAPAPVRRAEAAPERSAEGVTFDVATRVERRLPAPLRSGVAAVRGWPGPGLRSGAGRRGKVFGEDDRYRIYDVTEWPWRTVCKVVSRFPNGAITFGSAVLIEPSYALTAAHVVHHADDGGWAEMVTVMPGYEQGVRPFGTAKAVSMQSFSSWTTAADPKWDLALVELDTPVGAYTGWLGMKAGSDGELFGAMLTSGGYPGDLELGQFMYGAGGPGKLLETHKIYFNDTFDSAGGQSGSGVWVEGGEEDLYVVGIHAYEHAVYNSATRLTLQKLHAVLGWMGGLKPLPDLRIHDPATDLPLDVVPQAGGNVQVRLTNEGGLPANAVVEAEARTAQGVSHLLGRGEVLVPAGESEQVEWPVVLPVEVTSGLLTLTAHVNRDRVIKESDFTDNEVELGRLWVVPALEPAVSGRKVSALLEKGEVRGYEVEIPERGLLLKIKFKGGRSGAFGVRDPSGASVPVVKRKCTVVGPAPGTWRLLMARPEAERKYKYGFKTKLKLRKR